ncbi:MAG: hypothetical protein IPM24_03690 [Bryobacterales bacterium]|nr:hypothetical protein [Bryobacterales bacterium]
MTARTLGCFLTLALSAYSAGPLVFAHRGHKDVAPENTLAAFRAAFAEGISVELDVHLTGDGKLIVLHDTTVDRTTNGAGKVAEMQYDALRRLDAGRGERLPSLDESLLLLRECSACEVAINVKFETPALARAIQGSLQRTGMAARSFVFPVELRQAGLWAQHAPGARIVVKVEDAQDWRRGMADSRVAGLRLRRIPSKAEVDEAQRAGKILFIVFLENDLQGWRALREAGAHGFVTDYPAQAHRWFRDN